ncbi:MAG: trehalose-6-phosphate synthase [Actinomycetota bacterium]
MSPVEQTLAGRSLLVASNRGPVTFQEDDTGRIVASRGAGGLVTALTEVMKDASGLWVASAMSPGDMEMVKRHPGGPLRTQVDGADLRLRYLAFDEDTFGRYYNGISNSILWFMNHNMWNLPMTPVFDAQTAGDWRAYQQVNRTFAEALAAEVSGRESTSEVMLQDYHLLLTARYLKDLVPEAFSYHFTHTPWAQPSMMSVLPGTMATEILEGMLANDLLGFQCPRWSTNFMWCCRQILGAQVDLERQTVTYREATTAVRDYPISVDASAMQSVAHSKSSAQYLEWLEKLLNGRKLVLRIDRFELSKNILRGFTGFAQMLKDHPELTGKVVHLALLYPSREALAEYREYEARAVELAGQINDELGTDDWQPIVLINEANYVRAITSCRRYDVLMVNAISDGMNLVAKEGPAVNEVGGTVVLSRTTGAWDELREGVLGVNPYDVQELADALYRGLTMPGPERQRLAENNRQVVHASTPRSWVLRQLRDMALLA